MGFATKFWPGPTFFGPPYSEKFADWGYPSDFRFLVGSLELVGAVLLVVPRRRFRFLGAAGLTLLLVGANTTHIISESLPSERAAAATLLVVLAAVACANWPADWRDLLRPWQPGPDRPAPAAGRPG